MKIGVGSDVLSQCGTCKQSTWHVVFAMDGEDIARVQCKICMNYHKYRPAKTDKASAASKKPTGKSSSPKNKSTTRSTSRSTTKRTTKTAVANPEEIWEEAMKGHDFANARRYRIDEVFEKDNIIDHKKFGLGLVTEVMPTKIAVVFRDGQKTMVHNRR